MLQICQKYGVLLQIVPVWARPWNTCAGVHMHNKIGRALRGSNGDGRRVMWYATFEDQRREEHL